MFHTLISFLKKGSKQHFCMQQKQEIWERLYFCLHVTLTLIHEANSKKLRSIGRLAGDIVIWSGYY